MRRKRRRARRNRKNNKIIPIMILLMGPLLGAINGILFEYSISDVFKSTLQDYLYWTIFGTITGIEISLATIVIIVGIKFLMKLFKD